MKILGKVFLLLVIIVPIIICFVMLNDIWKEEDTPTDPNTEIKTTDKSIINDLEGNPEANAGNEAEENKYQMGSEEFSSSIGAPTSKIVEGATINVSVANVYLDPDENSELVDTIQKHTVVTTQSFPNGWSRIKSATVSGWVRSENISLPDNSTNVSVGSVVGKNGRVNVTSLNVRASASTTATVKERLTENTDVKILEVSGDGQWYRIQWNKLEGWVASQYITIY